MPDPPRPILLHYETPRKVPGRWQQVATICLAINWPAALIALLLIMIADVETVLGTGPMILTIGALLMVSGWMIGNRWAVVLGIGHAGISVLFFVLVQLLHWGPQDATMPFSVMGQVYVALTAVPAWLAWQRRENGTRG